MELRLKPGWRWFIFSAATIVAVVMGLILLSSTAQANGGTTYAYQGADYAKYTHTTNTHKLTVCDKERDGHGVYVEYHSIVTWGTKVMYDSNGSKAPCESIGTPDINILPIDYFRVCEEIDWWFDKCSSWKYS